MASGATSQRVAKEAFCLVNNIMEWFLMYSRIGVDEVNPEVSKSAQQVQI